MSLNSPVKISILKQVERRRVMSSSLTSKWIKFDGHDGFATDLFNWLDAHTSGRFIICSTFVAFEDKSDATVYGLCK